jgi:DnaJ-class molecular chaperone
LTDGFAMPKRIHYSILGVAAGVNVQAIKNAYRRLVLKVHPDAGNKPDPARFREVHEAYLFLSDAARRRAYGVEIGQAPGPGYRWKRSVPGGQ